MIGITDRTKQRKLRKSSSSKNAVCYYAYNGLIVFGDMNKGKFKEEGGGFHEG